MSIFLSILCYLVIGALSGFLGGLFGIGGGLVVVPSLFWLYDFLDFPQEHIMHLAIGTSLGAMVLTATASAHAHTIKKGVNWPLFRRTVPGVLIGAILSAWITGRLHNTALALIFGFFETAIGLYFCLFRTIQSDAEKKLPHFLFIFLIGILVGALSVILGIGGGTLFVPIFVFFHVVMKNAIATSALLSCVVAYVGTGAFLITTWSEKVVKGGVGYIYLPAALIIGISAMVTAYMGAPLTYKLSSPKLRRFFGIILAITGGWMLFKTLHG